MIAENDLRKYYELFGLKVGASFDTVRKVWLEKAIQFHPDKNHGSKEAEETFKEYSKAWAVLKKVSKELVIDNENIASDKNKKRFVEIIDSVLADRGATEIIPPLRQLEQSLQSYQEGKVNNEFATRRAKQLAEYRRIDRGDTGKRRKSWIG